MVEGDDPIVDASGEATDAYEVTGWERRTLLDAAAVRIHWLLRAGAKGALIGLALVVLVSQAGLAGYAILEQPRLGVLAALSAVPALLIAGFVWWADVTEGEPLLPLVVTFLLSVLFAGFAAVVNTLLQPVFGLIPVVGIVLFYFVVVGPIEETVKWLAIRVYAYPSEEFDAVIDGAVYGAAAGLGFATIENTIYVVRGFMQATAATEPAALQVALGTATARAFVGPGHVIYSSFAGYYLGLAKFNPDDWGPIVVKGLLVAVLIHATYNSLVGSLPFGAVPVPGAVAQLGFIVLFDGVFLAILFRKLNRYRRNYEDVVGEGGGG